MVDSVLDAVIEAEYSERDFVGAGSTVDELYRLDRAGLQYQLPCRSAGDVQSRRAIDVVIDGRPLDIGICALCRSPSVV